MFISKNKKTYGNYYLYYTGENGMRKSVSTKTSSRKSALEFLINFKNNQQKSFVPTIKPLSKFSELEEKVMQYVRSNFRKGTQNIYSFTFKNFKEILGDKQLNEITSHDIEFYKSYRLKEVSRFEISSGWNPLFCYNKQIDLVIAFSYFVMDSIELIIDLRQIYHLYCNKTYNR